jgi:hypothetical protein
MLPRRSLKWLSGSTMCPKGSFIVQLKEDEFRELTQDGRSVSEYVHKFTELARYAPDDVSTEVKTMARFLKGLRPELKTILASQDFLSFSQLSNKAMQVERAKEEEKGHLKRKFQVLRAQQQDRHQKLDPLDFHPRDQASVDQLDPPHHGSVSIVRAPFMPLSCKQPTTSECVLALRRSQSLQEQLSPAEAMRTCLLQLGEWPQEYLSTRPQGALLHQPAEQDPVSRKGTSKSRRCSGGSASSGSSAR